MELAKFCLPVILSAALCACSDSSNRPRYSTAPEYDFSAADSWLGSFVEEEDAFDGASIIIVNTTTGTLHRASFGNQTSEDIVLLASVSKVPSVSLLMALENDPAVNFDMDTPIENYLPWSGVYPGISTAQLVGNISGIPGLFAASRYGPHLCQYASAGQFPNAEQLQDCARVIYQTPLEGTVPPGTAFDYGGSQWHLAGAVAEIVGGDSWNNLFRRYITEPCELEVFEYGNMLFNPASWAGFPDSLLGRDNPNIEGGAISNIDDLGKLLRMHLNDGLCGNNRVISEQQAQRMRLDIGTDLGSREWLNYGRGYGLGWWVPPPEEGKEPSFFDDPGAFGSISWIDTERGYGAFIALEQYESLIAASRGPARIVPELIPIIESIMDNPL